MSSIKRRDFLTKAAAGAVGASAVAACGTDGASTAAAQSEGGVISGPRVQWRVVSSFPPSLDILHGSAERVAERVAELTENQFTLRVYAAGELVPGLQVMDAVEAGTAQAGLTAGYYYIGKNPALAFDATVPFGLSARQQTAWLLHGGGLELWNELYDRFNLVAMPCGNSGVQMTGWFREPVESVEQLNGLRMRIPGLSGQVYGTLGVDVRLLPGGEIFPALERGVIDAAEFVGPYQDRRLGLQNAAKYYHTTGWHEPATTGELVVMAASNLLEKLDPALLRPGRFDRQVFVSPPDVDGRRRILEVHTRDKPLSEIDLCVLASQTSGLTGADLANLCNEAAIACARRHGSALVQRDFDGAFERVVAGVRSRRVLNSHEKR
ncbi:MAG: hypothetical protein KY453_11975, partial [Gemmatimonadetes bacterium]|nr:hypothetical protein [Gemmatimonadota bacterium]